MVKYSRKDEGRERVTVVFQQQPVCLAECKKQQGVKGSYSACGRLRL
jgi:hypothetical protein